MDLKKIALKINLIYLICVLLIIASCSSSSKLKRAFTEDLNNTNYFKGLVVYNPVTKEELININGNKYFTPASNTKLFTFYTAYRSFNDSVVGLKYTVLGDSLIIKGTADPSFLNGFEENRTLELLQNTHLNVYLIDAEITDNFYGMGWSWDDYSYGYMPEKNLFPIYGNVVNFSKKGDSIDVSPNFFRNNIKEQKRASIGRDLGRNVFYTPKNKSYSDRNVPFKTSNQLVADLLSKELGKKVVLVPDVFSDLKDLYSLSYDSLYKKMLIESDNFIAEQLMLQVGFEVDSGYNVNNAIQYAMDNYLEDIPQKPRWVDGSGLSRYNLFTPESLVYLLAKMYREIPNEKLFSYMAKGGESGTLKNYFKNEQTYIIAKSGTLSNNYNLSGYLITKNNTVLIFSYMNNHYRGSSIDRKKEMKELFEKLYELY